MESLDCTGTRSKGRGESSSSNISFPYILPLPTRSASTCAFSPTRQHTMTSTSSPSCSTACFAAHPSSSKPPRHYPPVRSTAIGPSKTTGKPQYCVSHICVPQRPYHVRVSIAASSSDATTCPAFLGPTAAQPRQEPPASAPPSSSVFAVPVPKATFIGSTLVPRSHLASRGMDVERSARVRCSCLHSVRVLTRCLPNRCASRAAVLGHNEAMPRSPPIESNSLRGVFFPSLHLASSEVDVGRLRVRGPRFYSVRILAAARYLLNRCRLPRLDERLRVRRMRLRRCEVRYGGWPTGHYLTVTIIEGERVHYYTDKVAPSEKSGRAVFFLFE
ncbi:hypothetical protein B0H12DRAFT_1125639 [Mycena haematopus]|nr:hypothetical protein B0H12DRAFT_1125639 [Mycena haematopus]